MSENLFAKVNDLKICYKTKGIGFPVILIHGYAKKEFWRGQVDELAKQFQVVWFDTRGVGKSDRPNIPYSMKMLVDDLKGLMDFLEIQQAHLIGHSLGSMIAQQFTLKHPERVNKLILMSTTAKVPDEAGVKMFKNNQIALYEARLKDPIQAFYDKMKVRVTRKFLKQMQEDPKYKFHNIFSTEDLMKSDNVEPWTPQDIINHANAIAKHNTLNELNQIKKQTLVIAGDKDRLTPKISCIQVHEKIPNSKLKVIQGGHYFPLEKAPEVNQIIIEFLES